ncbi:HAD family phosphatase [uncultured Tateyamaria sp.]|uniref:HAD family hydrolase n=1 Tax=uncultured Tateyamaria sp. TaxID=455651 RepID=UPI00262F2754|nr:HAD family phosphatase [uncultured Tateyamaria sp.]
MMKPAAFLFDMDGLLIDSERVYQRVMLDILVPKGHAPADVEALSLRLVGNSGVRGRALLAEFLDGGVDEFNAAWHAGVRDSLAAGVPLRPTVRHSIEALAETGARMAVVTSTHIAHARSNLERAGLLAHFELVVGGDEVPANKPDPAPYMQAAAGLGLDPQLCAAFEDSDAGTTSAVRAGCHTTQIPDLRPLHHPLPDLGQQVAPDLASALMTLGAICQNGVLRG